MEISFKGKRALVTGASQGIGRDIALQLSKCGAQVVAVARNKDLLAQLKQEDSSIETIAVDLSDWKATRQALQNVGNIDLLVNNAGLAVLKPLLEMQEEDVDRSFDINVKAVINMTQLVAKQLRERNAPGSIVNISSQASMIGLQNHTVYCGTKGAVDAFTRAVALELGPHNIRVNCVNPTVIMTDMGRLGWSDPKVAEPMIQKIPLRRSKLEYAVLWEPYYETHIYRLDSCRVYPCIGSPQDVLLIRFGEVREVTDAVLYLLSDKASMITGTTLPIDGGYCAV